MKPEKPQQVLHNNNRVTTARSAILDCFYQHNEPIDYSQIMAFLSDNQIFVNKTTVYRQIGYLENNEIIQELDLGEGKKRYEISSVHHHHLRCTSCNKIECIKFKENFKTRLARISKLSKFKVTGYTLEFVGLCEQCQKTAQEHES